MKYDNEKGVIDRFGSNGGNDLTIWFGVHHFHRREHLTGESRTDLGIILCNVVLFRPFWAISDKSLFI